MTAATSRALALLACATALSGAVSARQTSPARPAVLGIAQAAFRVSDLDAARRFYSDLLGYDEVTSPRRDATAVFLVNDRQRIVLQPGLKPDQNDRLIHLALETGDVDQMRSYLLSRGMSPGDPTPDPHSGGRAIEVVDPDGHLVRFLQRDAAGNRVTDTGRRISRRILHAGLTVRDAGAADRFYKDVLGFSEIWRGGRTDDVTNWINMRVPDGTDYLEYMLVSGPVDRNQLGTLHHIALLVPDIQDALEMVRPRADTRNARATPQVGRNRRWQLNLYDPDGTRAEFMEPWTIR